MSRSPSTDQQRRSGPDTRIAIQRIAFDLFTAKGYEATSMREIADTLGIRKASLYYHFTGKEDILRSLLDQRGTEAKDLLRWIGTQPQTPHLVKRAVLRWIDSFSADKLRGIRFLSANPLLVQPLEAQSGDPIGSALSTVVATLAALLPEHTPSNELQLRMALLSINAAVAASVGGEFADEVILSAARCTATAVIDSLGASGPRNEAVLAMESGGSSHQRPAR